MPHQDALQGSLQLLVLTLLARRGPMHGYAMAIQIERLSDAALRVEEGSLYPALHRLEERGLIKARWSTTEAGRRARVYELTRSGRKRLDSEEARWRTVAAGIGKVLRHA